MIFAVRSLYTDALYLQQIAVTEIRIRYCRYFPVFIVVPDHRVSHFEKVGCFSDATSCQVLIAVIRFFNALLRRPGERFFLASKW
jgi:hypothetical protein